jgi:hypothetical protein
MDCKGINEKLSAYIENQLAPEEQGQVDHHLKTCQECRAALHDLRKTIEYAQGIEEMEPPAWLSQKVMAKVREESEKKGILRKLFYPLHIKIPIEVFATIAIAAITVFVFKAIQPVVKQTEMPLKGVIAPDEGKREKAAVKDERPASREMSSQSVKSREEEIVREKAAVPAAKAKLHENVVRESFSSDMKAKKELRSAAPESAGMFKQITQAITLVVYVKDIKTARGKVEKSVKTLGGSILETEPATEKYLYTVKIDSRKMEDLKNQLNRIGESEAKETDYETSGFVNVRIELMEKRSN